jgi:dGTP triphosphohydrolase
VTDVYEWSLVTIADGGDPRSPVATNRARIIYSSAFRGVQGKCQIVGIDVGRS